MIKGFFAVYGFGILMTMLGWLCYRYEFSPLVTIVVSICAISVGIIVAMITKAIFATGQNDIQDSS